MLHEIPTGHGTIPVERVLECYEALSVIVAAIGKSARTLVDYETRGAQAAHVKVKTFLLPGDVTEWVPAMKLPSNLPNGMVTARQREYGAGLVHFVHSDDGTSPHKKLVIEEKDSKRLSRGDGEEYQTFQNRYRFTWDIAATTLKTAEVRSAEIYSDPRLGSWSVATEGVCTIPDPFVVDDGWRDVVPLDIDRLRRNIDAFRDGVLSS